MNNKENKQKTKEYARAQALRANLKRRKAQQSEQAKPPESQ